jgi:hypothetical protein
MHADVEIERMLECRPDPKFGMGWGMGALLLGVAGLSLLRLSGDR